MVQTVANTAIVGLLAALAATSCAQRGDSPGGNDALKARLDQIDRRLALTDKQFESVANLAEQLQGVEARLGALEARLARSAALPEQAGAPPNQHEATSGTGQTAWSQPDTSGQATQRDRGAAFAALAAEYRVRVAKLQEEFRDDLQSPARQEAMSELQEWYRVRVQEVIAHSEPSADARLPQK